MIINTQRDYTTEKTAVFQHKHGRLFAASPDDYKGTVVYLSVNRIRITALNIMHIHDDKKK